MFVILSGWFWCLVMVILFISVSIYYKLRNGRLRTKLAKMKSKLTEKTELLAYSTQSEQRLKEETLKANNTKRDLLSKISHEIRTPMNAIWGLASLLNETRLNSEQREYTSALLKSGEGMLNIINDILLDDILQYSKIESGKDLEAKSFELRNTIEDVTEVFAARAANTGVEILYSIGDKVPERIVGDSMRLRQILMNLIENALRFTQKGHVIIRAEVAEYAINGLKLEFEVADTGNGMTFEKMQQLSMELIQPITPGKAMGAIGINLTMCKNLVSMMGGIIEVESNLNEGTTFRFTIVTGKSHSPAPKIVQGEMDTLKGKKALVFVKDQLNAQLLAKQLEAWKAQPIVAASAEQALDVVGLNASFNLLITDMDVPDNQGIVLAEQVAKAHPALPIIILHKHGDEMQLANNSLFKHCLSKPLKQHLFFKTMIDSLGVNNHTGGQSDHALPSNFAQQHPLNILIAEDDEMNQQMIQMVLKKLGYESQIAVNGKDVLEIVSYKSYDLILMDVQMPEMDGLEATRMIRLCLDHQPVIVAMTANTLQGDREACLESGMDDYISKPVNLNTLVSILKKWAIREKQKQSYSHHEVA